MYAAMQCTHHAFRQDAKMVSILQTGVPKVDCAVGQLGNQVVVDICLYPTDHERN